jgi:DNA polymerase alpha subunit A
MAGRSAQLKQLRELRVTGAKRLTEYSVNEEDALIFDNVPEDEYNAIALKNLREDNFIVDDNGEGYVENGLEDWDNISQHSVSSDEEEERAAKSNLC